MFFKIIDKLRKKPKNTKRMIALCTSAFITLLIGIVWLISYTQYVGDVAGKPESFSFINSIQKFGDEISSSYKKMRGESPSSATTSTTTDSVDVTASTTSTGSDMSTSTLPATSTVNALTTASFGVSDSSTTSSTSVKATATHK